MDAVGKSKKASRKGLKDDSGLLYMKAGCAMFMVVSHTIYYLVVADDRLLTNNVIYHAFETVLPVGFWSLLLPATAGAMAVERFKKYRIANRLEASKSLGLLVTALGLMIIGLTMNVILYRNLETYHPYFQSTLEFLAWALLIIWICLTIDFRLLFLVTAISLGATLWFFAERPTLHSFIAKLLFASDGRQFLWPLFPWVGTVSLAAGLQWLKGYFFEPKIRRIGLLFSGTCILLIFYFWGAPVAIDPDNVWSSRIFQKDSLQGITICLFYFFVWLASSVFGERWPARKMGIVHVFAQAILYVYVFHLSFLFFWHKLLLRLGYGTCLKNSNLSGALPCLEAAGFITVPLVFGSSWFVAWLITRYFMNMRIRIRLSRSSARDEVWIA